jgi:AcrR family transcriptional regulator
MPPKVKITKEDILAAALSLVREQGEGALNARTLAGRLNCSTQPIFCNYTSMEELRAAVMCEGYALYRRSLQEAMIEGKYPAYKASGMHYISFAVREPQLFQWLFMRARSAEEQQAGFSELDEDVLVVLMQMLGTTREEAERFHFTMWMWVHGVATSVATGFLAFDEESISACLSNVYFGLREQLKKEKEHE